MLARDLMSTGLLTFLPDMGLEAACRAAPLPARCALGQRPIGHKLLWKMTFPEQEIRPDDSSWSDIALGKDADGCRPVIRDPRRPRMSRAR